MTKHDSDNFGESAAAHALNALSPEERAAFEKQLGDSKQARLEALEFSETAAELGLAVAPVQPSASLKANLMAQLAATPQLAPPPPATPAAGNLEPVGPPIAAETAAERRAARRWFSRPVGILIAAAAAIALFFGGTLVGQTINSNQFAEQQASALAQINAAPDAQRATTTTADGQPATLVWSGELGQSALLVEDLPALPNDEAYQLWYINGEGAVSAGTFTSPGSGTVWRVLDGTMQAGDAVGVTVEPAGGSKQPTTKPIIAIQS
ncbi:anti-sigma factor [Leifsonia kafniensis]|uniref:Regulator of SigK n=1 Tax=Leifsonia kafniensis TaxID=475957 RepID=A0ABP7JZW9_9MICO